MFPGSTSQVAPFQLQLPAYPLHAHALSPEPSLPTRWRARLAGGSHSGLASRHFTMMGPEPV